MKKTHKVSILCLLATVFFTIALFNSVLISQNANFNTFAFLGTHDNEEFTQPTASALYNDMGVADANASINIIDPTQDLPY